jgi:hypothetical protein
MLITSPPTLIISYDGGNDDEVLVNVCNITIPHNESNVKPSYLEITHNSLTQKAEHRSEGGEVAI